MVAGLVEGVRSDPIGGRSCFLHRNVSRQLLHPAAQVISRTCFSGAQLDVGRRKKSRFAKSL
jgi:hypothetical protein